MGRVPWVHPVVITLAVITALVVVRNPAGFRRFVIGRPLRTRDADSPRQQLGWFMGFAVLAADLYSSVAYGPEAGLTELQLAWHAAQWWILPITLAIVGLLTLLIVTYILGVRAYPGGGGAYAIAKDNFSQHWIALLAASALLTDYILTVAVSVSAGVAAVVSAYPMLAPFHVLLSVVSIVLILVVNLRGVSDSARLFAWPTLLFIITMLVLVGTGIVDVGHHGVFQQQTPPFGTMPHALTVLLLLKAFSSACSALTGLETISNSVPIFRHPQAENAVRAYITLGVVTAITLLGFSFLLWVQNIPVNAHNTMLSQLAQRYFGHGPVYQVMMAVTYIVLILAANSTFSGFPQLAARMANDGYLPRALAIRGDRLVYSNGILLLAALAILLVEIFHAQTNALIPLYAIGVFVSFTIAQVGLARRWQRTRQGRWRLKQAMQLFGAVITALVALVFAVTKFTQGAWVVLLIIPVLVTGCLGVARHYARIRDELRIDRKLKRPQPHQVLTIVFASGIHRVLLESLSFAQSLGTETIVVYIGFDEASIEEMERKWKEWGNPCRLVTLYSEYRSLVGPVARFLQRMEQWEHRPDAVHVIIPQLIPTKPWQYLLHNHTGLILSNWLLRHRDVVVTTVPYHLGETPRKVPTL
ncbi:MAG: APC family permease [Firmicutes bacterium]|nr:APC family permease [Bacillota bacterium]